MTWAEIAKKKICSLLTSNHFTDTIFLSEFDGAHWIRTQNWGWIFAIGIIATTATILLIGNLVESNALFVKVVPVLGPDTNPEILPAAIWWRGYLAELNHGFCYLVIAPLCFMFLFEFLKRADHGLHALRESGDIDEDSLTHIREENTRIFGPRKCPLLFILVGIMIFWNLGNEFDMRRNAELSEGSTECIGYAQRPFFKSWNDKYDNATPGNQFDRLSNLQIAKQLANSVYERVLSQQSKHAEVWAEANFIEYEEEDLSVKRVILKKTPSKVLDKYVKQADIKYLIEMKAPLILNIAGAADKGLVNFKMGSNAHDLEDWQKKLHVVFLLFIGVLEGIVHGFGIWLLIKVCFWFYHLNRLLPTDLDFEKPDHKGLKLIWNDPSKSYGLRPLHSVYNVSAYLTACVAFVFVSQFLNEAGNGLIQPTLTNWQTIACVMLGGAACVALLTIGGSILFSTLRVDELEKKKRATLYKDLRSSDKEVVDTARNLLNSIDEQFTWPVYDKRFISSMLLALALFCVPVVVNLRQNVQTPFSDEVASANVFHNRVKLMVDALCYEYCRTHYSETFDVK